MCFDVFEQSKKADFSNKSTLLVYPDLIGTGPETLRLKSPWIVYVDHKI
jgi:hypothetical protein